MANFKKLGEVTLAENASGSANVLIEESGEIKRVPKTEVGGGGVKTAIIKDSAYDAALSYITGETDTMPDTSSVTYSCINMSFDEAIQIFKSGEPLDGTIMSVVDGACAMKCMMLYVGTTKTGSELIAIAFNNTNKDTILYWTADGISNSL